MELSTGLGPGVFVFTAVDGEAVPDAVMVPESNSMSFEVIDGLLL